jgi:hypothetical protein
MVKEHGMAEIEKLLYAATVVKSMRALQAYGKEGSALPPARMEPE